ncbi:MAG: hypothetical protein J7497_15230, partial [Chitinophagaceae bacterium]|nr:hypothetical protein [Chitinophagaceae bacterium]
NAVFDEPGNIRYQGSSSLYAKNLFNPYLQWEETTKWQGGIDIGLLRDRILFSATLARNRCSNQLIFYTLPGLTGFNEVRKNLPATVQNTSWEFTLNTVNFKSLALTWTSSVNLTIPRNKVIDFPDVKNTMYADSTLGIIVGRPMGTIYLYKFSGMDPATGAYLVKDKLGDPTTSSFGSPRQLFTPSTLYYGGFQNALQWKSIQLDFLLQFVRQWGTRSYDYWNGELMPGVQTTGKGNQPVAVLDRWRKPGDQALVGPYLASNGSGLGVLPGTDAFWTLDASYIRLKNVSLSWQMPPALCKKLGLQNGRLYSQGQNLLTFTNFSGLDPENQSSTSLPPLRTWTLGVQVVL